MTAVRRPGVRVNRAALALDKGAILIEITRLEAENAEQDATIVKVRELHKPVPYAPDRPDILECHDCWMPDEGGRPDWPCGTALIVYTPDEIKERTT